MISTQNRNPRPLPKGEDKRQRASKTKVRLHLIGNAHIDPVWLWDWREGMNEAIATCRAMVDLLNEFPWMHFSRGEAAVYRHIELHDPVLFDAIRSLVEEGRWDIVGGNWIQPDTNLPCTEAMLRQFIRGKGYFQETFGINVTTAWAADSFGHAAGLPDILEAAGMENYAFTRPSNKVLPFRTQAFWWTGAGGARILAYRPHDGWYACERAEIGKRLDTCLSQAVEEQAPVAAMYYGLGNHGGGPSRKHLREIEAWSAAHPEVEVIHSGLHSFFADLRSDLAQRGEDSIETHQGELNFCLRGCSASVARFKYAYRKAESLLLRAEKAASVAQLSLGASQPPIQDAWDTLLFNAFHDILPGSSIERAFDDQLAQIGSVVTAAQRIETSALTTLVSEMNTRADIWPVPEDHPLPQPVLVWNPHPWAVRRMVEIEVSLDYRPLINWIGKQDEMPLRLVDGATGDTLPIQVIHEEHDSMRELPWRRRVAAHVELPPMGWTILQMGLDEAGSGKVIEEPPQPQPETKRNFDCEATVGENAVRFSRLGEPWLTPGLQIRLYEDTWGAWGGMQEEQDSWLLTKELETLSITNMAVLESGPLRRVIWVQFGGKTVRSTVEVTFYIDQEASHIEMSIRAFLADRGARMKLVIPALGANGEAEYSVPGGAVLRNPCGEVPGGRWVRAGAGVHSVGFASNALYGYDTTNNELRATIARTTRYGSDVRRAPDEQPWQPCADLGEHVFRALLTSDWEALPRLAGELEEPLVTLTVPGREGKPWSKEGLIGLSEPFHLLALTPHADGNVRLRVQNTGEDSALAEIDWANRHLSLGRLEPGEIATWLLSLRDGKAVRVPTIEGNPDKQPGTSRQGHHHARSKEHTKSGSSNLRRLSKPVSVS